MAETSMKRLTIGGIHDELAGRMRREGVSLDRTVRTRPRRRAGQGQPDDDPDVVGTSLDHLIGTWTAEEADEMDRALGNHSRIDENTWTALR